MGWTITCHLTNQGGGSLKFTDLITCHFNINFGICYEDLG